MRDADFYHDERKRLRVIPRRKPRWAYGAPGGSGRMTGILQLLKLGRRIKQIDPEASVSMSEEGGKVLLKVEKDGGSSSLLVGYDPASNLYDMQGSTRDGSDRLDFNGPLNERELDGVAKLYERHFYTPAEFQFVPHAGARISNHFGHLDVARKVAEDLAGLYDDFYVMGSVAEGAARGDMAAPSDVDVVITPAAGVSEEELAERIRELGGVEITHLGVRRYEIRGRYKYKIDLSIKPHGYVESLKPHRPYLELKRDEGELLAETGGAEGDSSEQDGGSEWRGR
jgi:hypothetical protein